MAQAFEVGADIATILGIPILVVTYALGVVAESKRAEQATYDALDERYLDWQRIAATHPRLDIGDHPRSGTKIKLTADELITRRCLYQILISTFERAFLMYRRAPSGLRVRQWRGWQEYIDSFCRRPSFIDAFFGGATPSVEYSGTFDRDFERYLIDRMRLNGAF